MFDILHRVAINASPHEVYESLTEEAALAGWWTKNTTALPVIGGRHSIPVR